MIPSWLYPSVVPAKSVSIWPSFNEGYSLSEREVSRAFEEIFSTSRKRIIIATFASNKHRLQQVIDVASKYDRKVVLNGKSIINNSRIAVELGYLRYPPTVMAAMDDLYTLPDDKIVIIHYIAYRLLVELPLSPAPNRKNPCRFFPKKDRRFFWVFGGLSRVVSVCSSYFVCDHVLAVPSNGLLSICNFAWKLCCVPSLVLMVYLWICVSLWNATFPVPRVTMQVHHGNDRVLIRHYSKDDTERKFHRETATNAIFDFVV